MAAFEILHKEPEVRAQLQKNMQKLFSYTDTFLSSIFEHFQSMPISLRVLCKIVSMLAKQKVFIHSQASAKCHN